MIEGARSLVIFGWDFSEFFGALTIALGVFVVGVVVSLLALRGRLADKA